MPYIKQKNRKNLDLLIDKLANAVVKEIESNGDDKDFGGFLNYTCTRLILSIIKKKFGKLRYWIINAVTGTLKNISDEFYRRLGIPYENKQIKKSGDVDLYKYFENEIKKL